jgi:hypothetical protein
VRLFAARALSDLSDKGLPPEVIAAVQAFAAGGGTASKLVEVLVQDDSAQSQLAAILKTLPGDKQTLLVDAIAAAAASGDVGKAATVAIGAEAGEEQASVCMPGQRAITDCQAARRATSDKRSMPPCTYVYCFNRPRMLATRAMTAALTVIGRQMTTVTMTSSLSRTCLTAAARRTHAGA